MRRIMMKWDMLAISLGESNGSIEWPAQRKKLFWGEASQATVSSIVITSPLNHHISGHL